MNIVIDTNVYISSLLFKGKAREVYDLCIANTDVFISEFILLEIADKLHIKFAVPVRTTKKITNCINSVVEKVTVNTPLPNICRDKDDNHILQLCESVSAHFLITGDKDLLVLDKYKSTQILSPADFIKLMI